MTRSRSPAAHRVAVAQVAPVALVALVALVAVIVLPGCAWIPQSIVAREGNAEKTPYELVDGSPMYKLIPRGWISPVNNPRFAPVADAAEFMAPEEPVIVVVHGGETRIYSTWFLDGHEVVNDIVGGDPLAITWCPLVQAGVVYERVIPDPDGGDGATRTLKLTPSGRLWRDALVMWEPQTKSLWTQHDGRALQGPAADAGIALSFVPSTRTTWALASAAHPSALVLKKKGDLLGGGTATIYDGYLDRTDQLGIFGTHLADDSLPGKTLVLGFERPESAYALSLEGLVQSGGTSISVGGDPVFAHALPGGTDGRVWLRAPEGSTGLLDLRLNPEGDRVVDSATGASWSALDGSPAAVGAGTERAEQVAAPALVAVPTRAVYWFAWSQNHPESRVWAGEVVRDARDQATAPESAGPGQAEAP